jgi:hypothetical protein
MCDFDNPPGENEEFDIDDWEPTPEEIASIERAMQDMNDGFGYEWLTDEPGLMVFKCLKCGRTAELHERPFPHKYDCPMRDRIKD